MHASSSSCPICYRFLCVIEIGGKVMVLADCGHTKNVMVFGVWKALAFPVSGQVDYERLRDYWPKRESLKLN
jgi:hypothetical protein